MLPNSKHCTRSRAHQDPRANASVRRRNLEAGARPLATLAALAHRCLQQFGKQTLRSPPTPAPRQEVGGEQRVPHDRALSLELAMASFGVQIARVGGGTSRLDSLREDIFICLTCVVSLTAFHTTWDRQRATS